LPEPKKDESEDDDIFEGVGSTYNPLANLDNEEDSDEDQPEQRTEAVVPQAAHVSRDWGVSSPPAGEDASDDVTTVAAPAKRDYFKASARNTANGEKSDLSSANASSADATVRAALAKVRNLDNSSTLLQNLSSSNPNDPGTKEARLKKRAAELAASDRDMEDMDLGFGASRFDDADDMEREGEKVKFSQWKGLGADEEDGGENDGRDSKKQRKRGPKKKRGDKNKVEDVLNVMERQKEKNNTLG
jgi:hypothetical protein